VVYVDGPYDDDEEPDGSVRILLSSNGQDGAPKAATAGPSAGRRRSTTLIKDAAPLLTMKGLHPSLVSADLAHRYQPNTPWFIVLISVVQVVETQKPKSYMKVSSTIFFVLLSMNVR
jgi:hypothetical protein